jgi:hypothetical protein
MADIPQQTAHQDWPNRAILSYLRHLRSMLMFNRLNGVRQWSLSRSTEPLTIQQPCSSAGDFGSRDRQFSELQPLQCSWCCFETNVHGSDTLRYGAIGSACMRGEIWLDKVTGRPRSWFWKTCRHIFAVLLLLCFGPDHCYVQSVQVMLPVLSTPS